MPTDADHPSRRDFLRAAAATGGAITLGALPLLTGCDNTAPAGRGVPVVSGELEVSSTGGPTAAYHFEHFDGATLPAPWAALTAGTGTITFSDSNLVGTLVAGGDAAAVYRPIDLTQSQVVHIAARSPGGDPFARLQIVRMAAPPIAAPRSTFLAAQLVSITGYASRGQYLRFQHNNAANRRKYWNETGSVWSSWPRVISMPAPTPADDYAIYGIEIDGPGARIRMFGIHTALGTAYNLAYGPRLTGLTDWIPLSSMAHGSGPGQTYLILGCPDTDCFNASAFQVEWFAEAAGQTFHLWVNQQGNRATRYDIAHQVSYDPRMMHFLPDGRGARAITYGPAGSYDSSSIHWGSVLLDDDGTYWQTYSAANRTGPITIALARATSPWGPWVKSAANPILRPPMAGPLYKWFTSNTLVKDWVEPDASKRYKLIAVAIEVDPAVTNRSVLFTAPHPEGPWTYDGLLLDTTATEDRCSIRGGPVYEGGMFHFYYDTYLIDGRNVLRRATSSSIAAGTLVRDGVDLLVSGMGAAEAIVTAISGRIYTVTSTANFVKDQVVLCDHDSNTNNYGLSRVRKVLSGTQLELYHSMPGPVVGAEMRSADRGITTAIQQVQRLGGQYLWFVTLFKVYHDSPTLGAHYETSAVYTSPSLGGPISLDWRTYPSATLGRTAWKSSVSAENPRPITYPIYPADPVNATVALTG